MDGWRYGFQDIDPTDTTSIVIILLFMTMQNLETVRLLDPPSRFREASVQKVVRRIAQLNRNPLLSYSGEKLAHLQNVTMEFIDE